MEQSRRSKSQNVFRLSCQASSPAPTPSCSGELLLAPVLTGAVEKSSFKIRNRACGVDKSIQPRL